VDNIMSDHERVKVLRILNKDKLEAIRVLLVAIDNISPRCSHEEQATLNEAKDEALRWMGQLKW